MIKETFNRKALQRGLFVSAFVVGLLGVLSGAWQASSGNVSGAGGVIGGAVMLAVGTYGLKKTTAPAPRY